MGLRTTLDGSTVKLLKANGDEVARISDNLMTFKYTGYGGDIVCNPDKTTTVIGKFTDELDGGGTSEIINSGLYKVGENQGGINALNLENLGFDPSIMSDVEKWSENANWLNEAIARGDDIRVVSNPLDPVNWVNKNTGNTSFFKKEIDLLVSSGYSFNANLNMYILN